METDRSGRLKRKRSRDAFSDGEIARGCQGRGGDGTRYYDSASDEGVIRASPEREGTPPSGEATLAEVVLKAKHEVAGYKRGQVSSVDNFATLFTTTSDPLTWHCECNTINSPERKLIFIVPRFRCGGCGKMCSDVLKMEFCMANVRVNEELLLHTTFKQMGPECMANAICLVMLMMHTIDCILKDVNEEESVKCISARPLTESYYEEFPLMRRDNNEEESNCIRVKPLTDSYYKEYPLVKLDKAETDAKKPSSAHKFIKMALMLKHEGIKLKGGGTLRIGDVTFLDPNDHEAICTELANGVPLLAIFPPGVNFADLGYCQLYRPPLLEDLIECNNHHSHENHGPRSIHEAHMVVLLGPAFEGNDLGYWFANSQGIWCPRNVTEKCHDSVAKAVEYGIGKVEQRGLVGSVIKLWPHGKTADPGSVLLEDEDEVEDKYLNKLSNFQKFTGQWWSM